ncbi:MAG TPA: DNA polymerase III subunit delta' [Planctomycetaceae bacterium]|nr:DNA polymerase III subunit delta' [Planctomycetaceae bacterium]
MSHWDDVRGHEQVRKWFERAIERGRLSHSYIFAGPGGIGKKLFARKVAQALLCERQTDQILEACNACPNCARFRAGSHPDYYELGCPEGKREIPVDVFVGDLDHRGRQGLCYELSLRPMAGDRKVAVIDDAHLMNRESGNSLLKTLEEPPDKCLILLITEQEDALLPTIRSRCQLVRFPSLSEQDMRELLLAQVETTDEEIIAQAVRLSNGSLDVAKSLLEGIPAKLFTLIVRTFEQKTVNPIELNVKLMEILEESPDSATQRETCFWILRYLGEFFRSAGRSQPDSPQQTDKLKRYVPRIREAERQLHESMPISLWVQGLVDDLARIHAI